MLTKTLACLLTFGLPALGWASGGQLRSEGFALVDHGSVELLERTPHRDGDRNRLQQLRGPCIYFEHGGVAYVIRDPAVVSEARDLFEPQRQLAAARASVAARRAELDAQQRALEAKQTDLDRQRAALAGHGPSAEDGGAQRLAEAQQQLDAQRRELGVQRARLGEVQHQLDALDGTPVHAATALRGLADQALAEGKAQRLDRIN